MMSKFFENVTTLEELRKAYHDLLKTMHPDNGGSTEGMQALNVEYDKAFTALKAGAKIEKEADMKKWDFSEDEKIRETLCRVVRFEGVNVEVVGCWIWIDGATFPYREELKEIGFTWSKARKKWHFCPYETAKYYKGKKKSFDEIRATYGAEKVKTEKRESIA